jgi:thiol:disulfide interchange protein DsbD
MSRARARSPGWLRITALTLASLYLGLAQAEGDDFLPPEQAFQYAAHANAGAIVVDYNIHEGYYLYRKRMGFATTTPGVSLGTAEFPAGQNHHDDYFGDQEIYRGAATIRVPFTASGPVTAIDLVLKLQGCADAGLCYPPQNWTTQVTLPASAANGSVLGHAVGAAATKDQDFLPVEQAFQFSASRPDAGRVALRWVIADGYYLYRQRLHIAGANGTTVTGAPQLPQGLDHDDEYFGHQQIYRQELEALVPVTTGNGAPAELTVSYQGCADAGLCYPPQTQTLALTIGGGGGAALTGPGAPTTSVAGRLQNLKDELKRLADSGSVLALIALFFGAGVMLAFTPCVLPMVPILSGIIVGEGDKLTPMRSFALSVAYVLGMAATYTVAGAIAALAGSQVQAFFQKTWIIVVFAGLFVLLALAMFGVYELQMPSSIQTRFAGASNRIKGGKLLSTAVMGALSSLVVTACVAPPLVAAAAIVSRTGDVARGALAFFALAIGMGTPLLVVGASAGRLLPKAGPWMDTVKAVFGVMFLGVAVWLLDRILPPRLVMAGWAIVLGALVLVLLKVGLRGGRRTPIRLAGGAVAAMYGLLLLASAAAGGTDPLRPLQGTGWFGAQPASEELPFRKIASSAELDQALARARADHRPVMLDFYADWCVSCKEMNKDTFRDAGVRAALGNYVLLQADVTANNADDQALLHRFGILGPPTTTFFAADGAERPAARVVGFMPPAEFRNHLLAFERGS